MASASRPGADVADDPGPEVDTIVNDTGTAQLVTIEHEGVRAVAFIEDGCEPKAAGDLIEELSMELSHVTHHGVPGGSR